MNISVSAASAFKSFEKKLTEVKKELLFNLSKGLLYTAVIFLLLGFTLIILETVFNFESPVRKIFYGDFY